MDNSEEPAQEIQISKHEVIVINGKRKMFVTHKFTDTKEDVRKKVTDIILKKENK